jgi:hypothetical protein
MPNRPPKNNPRRRIPAGAKPVDEGLPISKPAGEDFFLAAIAIDTPAEPCWDDGFDIVGPWNVISRTISRFLAYDPRASRARVSIFQGQEARRQLTSGLTEEAKYQEQRKAQPNN